MSSSPEEIRHELQAERRATEAEGRGFGPDYPELEMDDEPDVEDEPQPQAADCLSCNDTGLDLTSRAPCICAAGWELRRALEAM